MVETTPEQHRRWQVLEFGILRSAGIPAQRLTDVLKASALAESVRLLRREASSPDVREAIWYNSPGFLKQIDRDLAGMRHSARTQRSLYGYLQRLCAKNDTVSRFGPIGYLEVGGDADEPPPQASAKPPQREAWLAFWACAALAEAISRDRELFPDIPLRIAPPLLRSTEQIADCALGQLIAKLHASPRPPAALASADGDPAAMIADLEALVQAGQIQPALLPHPISLDPLRDLRAAVLALPLSAGRNRWLRRLDDFGRAARKFAAAATLQDRAECVLRTERRLARFSPARPAPDNPDRRIFSEDALLAAAGLQFDRRKWDALVGDLELPLHLMAARAAARRADCREWIAELLATTHGIRGSLTLMNLAKLVAASAVTPPIGPRVARFDAALAALVARAPSRPCGTIDLAPAALETLLSHWPKPAIAFASPDMLLRANGLPVIGEVHGGALVWGCLLRFADPAKISALRDQLNGYLKDLPVVPCELMLGRRAGRSFLFDLPAVAVEAAVPAGPNAIGAISIDEVIVDPAHDFALYHPAFDRPLELLRSTWTGPFADLLAVEVESFRVGNTDHWPRIVIGETVVQRAGWRISGRNLQVRLCTAPSGNLVAVIEQLRARHMIPSEVFVRTAPRVKPVYLDLASPLCCDWLRHAISGDAPVDFVEALPAPDEAWFDGGNGPVTCEFRLTACLRDGGIVPVQVAR